MRQGGAGSGRFAHAVPPSTEIDRSRPTVSFMALASTAGGFLWWRIPICSTDHRPVIRRSEQAARPAKPFPFGVIRRQRRRIQPQGETALVLDAFFSSRWIRRSRGRMTKKGQEVAEREEGGG